MTRAAKSMADRKKLHAFSSPVSMMIEKEKKKKKRNKETKKKNKKEKKIPKGQSTILTGLGRVWKSKYL
jgi:hypothetical protein